MLKFKQEDYFCISTNFPFIKYFEASKFAEILLKKAIVHDNIAVRRYCVKSFLKFKIHIKNFEKFIFSLLFEILNTSVFYKDVSYEEDSKFYPIVTNYFVGIFSDLNENDLKENLRNYLNSIEKFTAYCHPLIALLNVFEKLGSKTTNFFGKEELKLLELIVKKNYEQLQYRKRIQFFNCIMHILFKFLNHNELDFEFLKYFISFLPIEIVTFKSFLHSYETTSIFDIINQKYANNQFINNYFLHREKIFVWLMLLPKNIEVLSNVYALTNKLNKYYIK